MEINQDFVTVGSVILAKMETKAGFVIARQQKLGQKNPSLRLRTQGFQQRPNPCATAVPSTKPTGCGCTLSSQAIAHSIDKY